MIQTATIVVGGLLLAAGLTNRFGWDIACIVTGALLIGITIFGAINK